MTCPAQVPHPASGIMTDAACVEMTSYEKNMKTEITVKTCYAQGWCEQSNTVMELAKEIGDEETKKVAKSYKCVECTTDNCNGATELRAGGVMTAILASVVTLLSVRN